MARRNKKAQTMFSYAMLVVVIVAALVGMRAFMLRSLQAKYRETADVFGQGEQYQLGKGTYINSGNALDITPDPGDALNCEQIANAARQYEAMAAEIQGRGGEAVAGMENGVNANISNMTQEAVQFATGASNDVGSNFAALATSYLNQAAELRNKHPECF